MLIIATILIYMGSTFFLIRKQLITKAETNAAQSLRLVSEKLDMFTSQVGNDALRVLTEEPCQTILGGGYSFESPSSTQQYKMYRLMQDMITSVDNYATTYGAMIVYDTQGRAFSSSDMVLRPDYMAEHQKSVLSFLASGEIEAWLPLHKSPLGYKSRPDTNDCFSYLHKVYDMMGGRLLGVLELSVGNQSMVNLYKALLSQDYRVLILDEAGNVISSQDSKELYRNVSGEKWYRELRPSENQADKIRLSEADNRLYIERSYPLLNASILSIIPAGVYMYDVTQFTMFTLIIAAALLVVATWIAWRLIRSITHPISVVTRTIVAIGGGDYGQRVHVNTTGEIGTLALEINRMTDQTSQLMQKIKESERKKREYELSLVQMQMTPHFFYNILESICGLILMDEKKTAIKTIHYLSDFYRGVLNKGLDIIEIGEEIGIARNYLSIMTVCHPGMFEYEIHCPSELSHCHVNKLTLQPILENAIHHGMEGMKGGGRIKIEVSEQGGNLLIRVEDNGRGMPQEIMENMVSGAYVSRRMDSFGLRNTDDRIKLYFGAGYGVSIESLPGQGTSVTIALPVQ
jgi:sensor histidine kinase YesM